MEGGPGPTIIGHRAWKAGTGCMEGGCRLQGKEVWPGALNVPHGGEEGSEHWAWKAGTGWKVGAGQGS